MTQAQENEFRRFLEGGKCPKKTIMSLIGKIREVEADRDMDIETIVASDEIMYRVLISLRPVRQYGNRDKVKAVCKYYEMRRGNTFVQGRGRGEHSQISRSSSVARKNASNKKTIAMCDISFNLDDFKEVLRRFRNWLIEESGLTPTTADQYKVYIKKLCIVVDNVFGPGWVESLLSGYARDLSVQKLNQCSWFIESQISNCPTSCKKAWRDWRSAFYRFEEFLFDITDSWNEYPKVDKQKSIEHGVFTVLPRLPDKIPSIMDGEKNIIVATYTHDELCRRFLGRLKTQSRYYPEFKLLFPTRLMTKIFKNAHPNEWIKWLKNGIENMHMLKDDTGNYESVSNVKKLVIFSDGTVVVVQKDNSKFELMTRTAVKRNGRLEKGPIMKEKVKCGLRDISIDHIKPLENAIRENSASLMGLKKLMEIFKKFKNTYGVNPREERKWATDLFKQYQEEFSTGEIRKLIINDLEKLNLEYELMDTCENSKKGKNQNL